MIFFQVGLLDQEVKEGYVAASKEKGKIFLSIINSIFGYTVIKAKQLSLCG